MSSVGNETNLTENDPKTPIAPSVIPDDQLTYTQRAIKSTILAADDSYRVRFVTPVKSKISIGIVAKISTSYSASDVSQQIAQALLDEFGARSAAARRGRQRPQYQRIYALLRQKVQALSDGESDLTVNITEPASLTHRPEMWRYLHADTLSIKVETANIVTPSWG